MGGKTSKEDGASPTAYAFQKQYERNSKIQEQKRQSDYHQNKLRSSTTLKYKESDDQSVNDLYQKPQEQRQPHTPMKNGNHHFNIMSPFRAKNTESQFIRDAQQSISDFNQLNKIPLSRRQNVLPQMTQRVLVSQTMVLCKFPIASNTNHSTYKSDQTDIHGSSFISSVKMINENNKDLEEQNHNLDMSLRQINQKLISYAPKNKTAEKMKQMKQRESYEVLSGRKTYKTKAPMTSQKAKSKVVHTYNQEDNDEDDDEVPAESKTDHFPQLKFQHSANNSLKENNLPSASKPPFDSKLKLKQEKSLTCNTSAAAQILYEKKMERKNQEKGMMTKVSAIRPAGKILSQGPIDKNRSSIRASQNNERANASNNFTNDSGITLKKLNSLFMRQQNKKVMTSSPKPKQRQSDFNSLGYESKPKEAAQQLHSSYRPQVGMWKKNIGNPIGVLQTRQISYQDPLTQSSVITYSNNQYNGDTIKSQNPRMTEPCLPSSQQQEDQASLNSSFGRNEYREMALPSAIVITILMFNMNDYPKYIRISAAWHCCINQALDEYCNQLENTFIKAYSQHFNFLRSSNEATPIYFCQKLGTRLDRILQCEILNDSKIINSTYKIGYSFQYLRNSSQSKSTSLTRYAGEHRFDVLKKGQRRVTWLHIGQDQPPYSQNEIQMSPGDIIEIPICIFNMNGLIDLSNFEWDDPSLHKILNNEKDPLSYNRDIKIIQKKGDRKTKVHANTNRICEIEDAVVDWINVGQDIRDQPKLPIPINIYEYRFKLLSVQFNELDQHFNKIVLQTVRKGIFDSKTFGENIVLQVNQENEPIVNEIRKRGVMFDRNKAKERIQLRIGDILVLYHSKAIPQELQAKYSLPESAYASVQDAASYQSQMSQQTNEDYGTNRSKQQNGTFSPKNK